jgi:hypothetical protein
MRMWLTGMLVVAVGFGCGDDGAVKAPDTGSSEDGDAPSDSDDGSSDGSSAADDADDDGTSPYDSSDDVWFEVAHTFSDYGTGLRRIRVKDGGQDSEFWAGHYGIRIDDASVVIVAP